MMKIKTLIYNWRVVSDGVQTIDVEERYDVGMSGVVEIEEHPAAGEGDRWFYTVKFENGNHERIFNPNRVFIAQ